ncbi:MAG: hypothetical protein ACFFD3_07220 [Candidatus Thorarchaeota archaeon]
METESEAVRSNDTALDEFEAMSNFAYSIVSLLILGIGQLLLFPAAVLTNLIIDSIIAEHALRIQVQKNLGFPVMTLFMFLIATSGLLLLQYALPRVSTKLSNSIITSSGILMLILPVLPLGGYVLHGGAVGTVFLFQLSYWFMFPIIGLAVILMMRHRNRIQSDAIHDKAFFALIMALGCLSIVLYGYSLLSWPTVDSSGENFPTPFSLLGMTVGVFIVSSAITKIVSEWNK